MDFLEEEAITVVVRCRELDNDEISLKSPSVVTINKPNKVSVRHNGPSEDTRQSVYVVDQVFGPDTTQDALFDGSIQPFCDDFLSGYNCSILAYGITSAGKTYTLSGSDKISSDLEESSGIIPRLLFKIFENLESNRKDHVVKCSFVEIYNEELKDLLDDHNNGSLIKKLRIMDSGNKSSNSNSSTRDNSPVMSSKSVPTAMVRKRLSGRNSLTMIKPTGRISFSRTNSFNEFSSQQHQFAPPQERSANTYIQNLQEFHITNAKEGIELLRKGLWGRKIASTKSNEFSTRSNTVFNITLYKKEDDNAFRMSKLSIIDLAGSENSLKMNESSQKHKEVGLINQSLQTFNRVIDSITEKSIYVPFKESKLTHLLQDSFEGSTKTLFLANISPAKIKSQDVCSTLEYASKMSNIKNKPKLGPSITKEYLVKTISNELAKIKSDLLSAKSKEGVYMSQGHFNELTASLEENKKEIRTCKEVIKNLNSQGVTLRKDKRAFEEVNELQRIKLKSMTDSISSMYTNIEKQQSREHDLIHLTDRLKKTVQSMKATIDKYSDRESTIQDKMESLFDKELTKLKLMLIANLEDFKSKLPKEDDDIQDNMDIIQKEIVSVTNNSQLKVRELFSDCVNQVLTESPIIFSNLGKDISELENTTRSNHGHLAELLSDVSEEFNNLKQYINDKLFKNNHEDLLNTFINKTYHQVQSSSSDFIQQLDQIMSTYLKTNKNILTENIKSVTSEVIDNEMNHFNPEKEKWEKSIDLIEKSKESNKSYYKRQSVMIGNINSAIHSSSEKFNNTMRSIKGRIESSQKVSILFDKNKTINKEFSKVLDKNKILKENLNNNVASTQNSIVAFDKLDDSIRNVFENDIETSIINDNLNLEEIFEQLDYHKIGTSSKSRKSPLKQGPSPIKGVSQPRNLLIPGLQLIPGIYKDSSFKRPNEDTSDDSEPKAKIPHK